MNPSTQLLLIRHGEVEERYHRVFGGRIDMELSPLGHQQAARLGSYLKPGTVDAIYASPMRRAQQTLAPLAQHGKRDPVTRPELREVDFGDWTGLRWDEVHHRYNVSAFAWLDMLERAQIPNAECAVGLRNRVEPCLREALDQHAGQTIAFVCHGGVIRMMLSVLLDLPLGKMSAFEIDYASLTQVQYAPGKVEVRLLNFTPWRDLTE